jgi:transposase
MERYIGIDVHAASCTLAVISQTGKRLKDFPVETNGQALVEAIRMIPGHKHLVFEEGLQSAWLYETLSPHVEELVVAGITESRGPKSDKRDAYGLAEKLRVGNLDKPVFKAPRQFTRLRELSRIHMTLVGDVVRAQSRIKSLYRSRGVLVAGVDVYSPRRREAWQKQLCSSAQTRATRLYEHLDFLLEQKKQAEADLLREAKQHPIVRILETAPGFGPIRAARLVPVVITPHRFRTKRQFWSYCGLGIVTRSSSDWIQTADGSWIKTLEEHFQGCRDDADHAAQQGSHACALRAAPRWRHEADAREAELGAHDRSDGAADVEGRGGVRPRSSQSAHADTRRLGNGSIGRVDEKAVLRARSREECSHATLCVAAEVSIHEFPGRRPRARRSQR